ncbi:MAG: Ig-like domain-containing protein, partial [Ferruginibacter sp.]|nr:Ig-like domain-containing protein [Rhodoferax sp.]
MWGGGRDPVLGVGSGAGLAPTVISVSPLSGAGLVAVNTKKITASFSKSMDGTTLTATSFTLACPAGTPVAGVVTYDAAARLATLTLPTTSALPASVLCTATVTTVAKDTAGFAMASNYAWNFTTGTTSDVTAPTVSETINANGATGVATNTRVGATFSEPVDPASLNASTFGFMQGATAVAGTVTSSGTHAVFTPATALAPNTTYTATLSTGVMDLAGNALASPYVWSWTTGTTADTMAPMVSLVYPADNATQVSTTTAPSVTFSKAMDASSITPTNFTV